MEATCLVVAMIASLFFGIVWGVWAERQAWLARAIDRADGRYRNSTPHHCNGKFYYVVEEGTFCTEYELSQKGLMS